MPRQIFQFCGVALLMAGMVPPSLAQTSGSSASWFVTWGAAPRDLGPISAPQTIRQFVHTSIGGSSARIHLSNEFGAQPLVIQDVHIAQRNPAVAGGILANTDHKVTFSGNTSLTIPTGAVAVSDPVTVAAPSLSDMAISFFLPASVSGVTGQGDSLEISFLAPGDVSGAATMPGAQGSGGPYFFLTALDIQGPGLTGAVVALGASITAGIGTNFDANQRWTNILAQRLVKAGIGVGVLNSGISGDNALTDDGGPSGERRFDSDVIAQSEVKWVIISDFPINNFGSPAATGAQPIASLVQFVARAHQKRIKVICSTLTPFKGSQGWTPDGESGREAYNAFVRTAASGCDGIVDQAKATSDPKNPQQYLPAFNSGDGVHPNTAGHAAIGNSVNLALFQ
jgi:lysophospholipase L1-like esterase